MNGKKTSGKKFSKIWVYLARLSSFWEILENAVPFTTGSCRKRKPDFWVAWKAPLLPRLILASGLEITALDSETCRSEKNKTKQNKARQKPVVSRGLQCLGFPLVRFCFFSCQLQLNSRQRRQSHHGPVSRHVCFGGKRSNGTDSSITFLPLVVKISLLLATFCFGVIYLVTNNIPSRIGLLPTSSPVP